MEAESVKQIIKRRKEIEQELEEMLRETESDFSLQHIRDIIFNEKEQDDLTKVVSMFDNGQDFSELENILQLVNDAWNYFPHKILNGLSPAEMVLADKTSIYEEYAPRNEFMMCDLFETLLFMKVDEIMPGQMDKKDMKVKERLTLSDKEMDAFSKLGVINRIFRRWYQTNWGYENVSDDFDGETPRQELARVYPGIKRGKDYFSVNLEKEAGVWKIKPYYYPEAFLKSEGGLFAYGLKKLKENDGKIGVS